MVDVNDAVHGHSASVVEPLYPTKGIKLNVDLNQASKAHYGYGDGKKENIVLDSFSGIDLFDEDQITKTLTAHYRFDHREGDYLQKALTRQANSIGREIEVLLRFVYDHETADRILDYLRKDEIAKAMKGEFEGKKETALIRNDVITLNIPSIGVINSDWQIEDIDKLNEIYRLGIKSYNANKYVYTPSSELPDDETLPIPPDFSDTPPDPVANFNVVTFYEIKPDGSAEVFFNATFDPPEQNYSETIIEIKKTSDSIWSEAGRGLDDVLLSGFVPGQSYDFRAIPVNQTGTVKGLVSSTITLVAGGDLTNPATPTGLSSSAKHGVVTWTWNKNSEPTVQEYVIQIWTSSSGGTLVKEDFVKQPVGSVQPSYDFKATSGNLNTTVTRWAQVKARKFNGRESAYTSRDSQSTGNVQQLDVGNTEITGYASTFSLGASTTISVSLNCRGNRPVDIIAEFYHDPLSPTGSPLVTLLRDSTTLVFRSYSDLPSTHIVVNYTDNPSAGNHTYTLQLGNTPASTRSIKVQERRA